MTRMGQPPSKTRYTPPTKAVAKARLAARRTWPAEASPAAVTLRGPRRAGPSLPRSPSAASLYRLVPAWISAAQARVVKKTGQAMGAPPYQARALPHSTGMAARVRVRGRTASHHRASSRGHGVGAAMGQATPANTASHTVGEAVRTTRWRQWAGSVTQPPAARSSSRPSSKPRVALPVTTSTHSSSGWSYQKPGG